MGIILVLTGRSESMDDQALKDLFDRQGKALATLAVRVTTLEEILLEKGTITEAEVSDKAVQLSKEFVAQTQAAFRREAEGVKREDSK
jgi:hypothetical protein